MTNQASVQIRSVQMPVLLLSVGLGALAGLVVFPAKPIMIVLAAIALPLFVVVAQRPTVALVTMVVLEVTNVSGVLADRVSLPVFQASLALGAVALILALRDPRARAKINQWTLLCAGFVMCYLVTQAIAAVGSSDVATSVSDLSRTSKDCLFLMLVLMLGQVTGAVREAVAAVVIPLAILSALTVVNQVVFHGANSFGGFAAVTPAMGEDITTLRYGGPLGDSNFWGRELVMGLPLAAALAVLAWGKGLRRECGAWIVCVVAIFAGIYLTQSRGTFLAAAAAVIVWALATGRVARKWLVIAAPVVVVGALLAPGIGDRLTAALGDLSRADVNSASVDRSVLGRLAAQEMSVMMFDARPVFGFGPGTFAEHDDEFAGRVATAVLPEGVGRQSIEAPHNIYLGLLAETGVVGLIGWLVMIIGFITVLLLRLVAQPRAPDRALAAGLCAAIVAFCAASVVLHLAYFRTFGIVLALTAALAPDWPIEKNILRRFSRDLAIWLVAMVIGAGAGLFALRVQSEPAVTATQQTTLLPKGAIDGYYAYGLDIRSRKVLLPTFSELLAQRGSSIVADPVRGTLMFEATAGDEAGARTKLVSDVDHAQSVMAQSAGRQFSLVPLDTITTEQSRSRSTLATVVSVVVGICAAVLTGLLARRRFGRLAPTPSDVASEDSDRQRERERIVQ